MPTKQQLQVEIRNELVIHLLLSLISNLHFKPLLVPIEANSGSVYWQLLHEAKKEVKRLYTFACIIAVYTLVYIFN